MAWRGNLAICLSYLLLCTLKVYGAIYSAHVIAWCLLFVKSYVHAA
uniref:Uncharacterized protein n=1 Tax=Arundo donax TaxID=35708 RepID=A0A0A9AHD4_ARUDO